MSTLVIDVSDLERNAEPEYRSALRSLVAALTQRESDGLLVRLVHNETEAARQTAELLAGDVWLDTTPIAGWSARRSQLTEQRKAVGATIFVLVDSLAELQSPALFSQREREAVAGRLPEIRRLADLVLVFSQSTARTLEASLGATEGSLPILVLGVGASAGPAPRVDPGLPQTSLPAEYLLFLPDPAPTDLSHTAIAAMKRIARAHPGVGLVIVGRSGSADRRSHRFAPNTYWIENPSDTLRAALMQRAVLAIVLSDSAGDGSVVANSLAAGVVTIASGLDAYYEAAGGYADYVHFNSADELAETALTYLSSPNLAERRRAQILDGFAPPSWEMIATNLVTVVGNLGRARRLAKNPFPERLQWVFISNQPDSLCRTIADIDERVDWVTEYLVVVPSRLQDRFTGMSSRFPVRVIAEEDLLGPELAAFRAADHVKKNWMLRSALVRLADLGPEFIMLDDDNRPLGPVSIPDFLTDDRRYIGYYFYDLTRWPHRTTDYDYGMQGTRSTLAAAGFERLAYSSHQPQIINKELFAEAARFVAPTGPSVEEWSIYFNYLASRYPTLLAKRVFRTFNWPDGPEAWERAFAPTDHLFENFYSRSYSEELADAMRPGMTAGEKREWDAARQAPYERSSALYAQSRPILAQLDLVHGAMVFESVGSALLVTGVPQVITAGLGAPARVRLAFVLLRHDGARGEPGSETQFCYRVLGTTVSRGMAVEGHETPDGWTPNGVIEMNFPSRALAVGVYDLEFFAIIDGDVVTIPGVTFRSRLVVCGPDDRVPDVYAGL